MTTNFAVRPEALLDARRVLLRHAQELTAPALDPPATGVTSTLTREVLEHVVQDVEAMAEDLRGLGAGLGFVVELAALADGGVWAVLDALRGKAVS